VAPRLVSITLGPNDDGRRIDRIARKAFPGLPLSRIYSAIRSGDIRLNGKRVKGEARVASGDSLDAREWLVTGPVTSRGPGATRTPLDLPRPGSPADTPGSDGSGKGRRGPAAGSLRAAESGERGVSPHAFDLRIVYQSPHLLVVSKLRGELVHGADSLETLVRDHLAGSLAAGVSFTPGPVHRLDRNTTGLVVYSASLRGAQEMSKALRGHRVRKLYAAVLSGIVAGEQRWENRIVRDQFAKRSDAAAGTGGQDALTIVRPIATAHNASLVVAQIVTGRTHQIRAHSAENKTPLLGDRKYGGPSYPGGFILHAGALAMTAPVPEIDFAHLWTPLPTFAEERVRKLFGSEALTALYEVFSVGR
jgi:23S rRNA pseudouridine955/2504/2580 synthase